MHKKETDILQIRKYLDGKLNSKAMHQLERRAQADPFFMDALEGYSKNKAKQETNLNDLAARLKKRTETKKAMRIPFRVMGIAASVLIVCIAGVWWLQNGIHTKTKPELQVARVDKSTVINVAPEPTARLKTDIKAKNIIKPAHHSVQPEQLSAVKTQAPAVLKEAMPPNSLLSNDIKDSVAKDTTPLNEMIVMDYTGKKDKNADTSTLNQNFKNTKQADTGSPIKPLIAIAPGVKIQSTGNKLTDINKLAANRNSGGLVLDQLIAGNTIAGKVIAKDDGLPVKGITVQVAGTNKTAQTNAKGYFSIKADSDRSKLIIGGPGYQTKMVSSNNRDSVKSIALDKSNNALSEVLITRNTDKTRDNGETTNIGAHPQAGWEAFKKYLNDKAISADGKTGVVKLYFIVGPNGSITEVKVIKGVSPETDKKAVDLLKGGPNWVGNSDKKPEKVNLSIQFK